MQPEKSELNAKWIKAAADVIEYENSIQQALVTGAPNETVQLCLFASLVPSQSSEHYMKKMTELHNKLIKQYPEMVNSRSSVRH